MTETEFSNYILKCNYTTCCRCCKWPLVCTFIQHSSIAV